MDYVLSAIDDLASLEPLLVPIAKVSLAILVCIVAYVPIAVLALILNKAFKRQFDNATDFLNNLSSRFIGLRLKTLARTKRNLAKFYVSYSSIIPLEAQSLTVTTNALQGALDSFEQDLERAPLLAADQEARKTELVAELNNKLDELSTGNTSLRQINIPDLILDPEQETRKRSAKASLIIFCT